VDGRYWVRGLYSDAETFLERRYIEAIDQCCLKNIHIAVFPEMTLTSKILGAVSKNIQGRNINDLPEIIFLGTIWEDGENKSAVVSKTAELIFHQQKQIPYSYTNKGKNFTEALKLKDREIHIIDINGIGRIFTQICKDIDDDKLSSIVKIMKGDYVFVSSFTQSLDLTSIPRTLAERFHSTTILCNTCSAFDPNEQKVGEKIGFVCVPAKKDKKRAYNEHYYQFDKKCANCKNYCGGWLAQFDFKNPDSNNHTYAINIHRL